MSKTAMIRARIEPELKDRAEATLEQLGLSATTAITLFYLQIIQRHGLPFEVRMPNLSTRRAIQDARVGRGVTAAESMEDLFAKLDAPVRKKRRRVTRLARTKR
ncbi:MAG TPA: type II toxin-antitoxin system RelB/DinJ family antitoxin [Gemmatimonadaceae bacterium]|jgi:DNA-damage-inducible protein J